MSGQRFAFFGAVDASDKTTISEKQRHCAFIGGLLFDKRV